MKKFTAFCLATMASISFASTAMASSATLLVVANAANTDGHAYKFEITKVTSSISADKNNNNVKANVKVGPGNSKQTAYKYSNGNYNGSVSLALYNEANPEQPIPVVIDVTEKGSAHCVSAPNYGVTVNYGKGDYYGQKSTIITIAPTPYGGSC